MVLIMEMMEFSGPSEVTGDEWDSAPDTGGFELIDGMVRAMAAATPRHEHIKAEIRNTLRRLVGADLAVTTQIEVRIGYAHRRTPDVIVVRSTGFDIDRSLLDPAQVMLAVEVVSPGSETTDRKHKPAEYADAGIPHYWRVETKPRLEVHTFRLRGLSSYVETGLFKEGDRVGDPALTWASFNVDDLLPDQDIDDRPP
jgi:Uma2 family endonuclease